MANTYASKTKYSHDNCMIMDLDDGTIFIYYQPIILNQWWPMSTDYGMFISILQCKSSHWCYQEDSWILYFTYNLYLTVSCKFRGVFWCYFGGN